MENPGKKNCHGKVMENEGNKLSHGNGKILKKVMEKSRNLLCLPLQSFGYGSLPVYR